MKQRRCGLSLICGILATAAALAHGADIGVDCSQKHQIIHGFGTCIGNWEGDAAARQKTAAVEKLYAQDLGCSLMRIPLEGRVCKETPNVDAIDWKNFDWNRQNQGTPMDEVAGIEKLAPGIKVIASEWTPPHWMKEGDRLLYGDQSCGGHLRADRMEHFAKYLAEYILGIKAKYGVPIYAVSIQNELVFNEPYMSCVYDPKRYHDAVMAVGGMFKKMNIDTKIMGPEDMTFFPDRFMSFVDPVMHDPLCKDYMGFFCSHGYTDGVKSEGGLAANDALWSRLKGFDRELWMTETSGESPDWPGAMETAAKIHNGLVAGNVSGWTYWQFTAGNPSVGALAAFDVPTKKFYASKHYFKFIRPGARRVEAGPDTQGQVNVSAFEHEADHTLTIVLLNRGAATSVNLTIKAGPAVRAYQVYRSSADENCLKLTAIPGGPKITVDLPASSIVTLYGGQRNQ